MSTRIVLLCSFLFSIFSFYGVEAGPGEAWYNQYTGITIYTEYFNNGMNVRSLYQRNNITWFKRKSSKTFRDGNGNIIQIINDRLIFKDRRKRAKLTFIPLSEWQNRPQKPIQSGKNIVPNDDWDHDNTYSQQGNDQLSVKSDPEIVGIQQNTIQVTKLEGTWAVANINKKVYIVETRDGIKARFTDDLKWYAYDNIPGTHIYINEDKEEYILDGNKLTWKDQNSKKVFIMYKISNDLTQ